MTLYIVGVSRKLGWLAKSRKQRDHDGGPPQTTGDAAPFDAGVPAYIRESPWLLRSSFD